MFGNIALRKIIALALPLALALTLGFAPAATLGEAGASGDRPRVVATIFPAYDLARAVGGERAEVSMLLPPGAESHSYEPSPRDIRDIAQADLFVYNGGESDHWVDSILSSLGDEAPRTLRMTDCVALVPEELKAGMQAEAEDEHGETEMDEHVWTSPRNAAMIARAIAQALCDVDAAFSADYEARLAAYEQELAALDARFQAIVDGGARRVVVFGDRFPLRYFADAYGLDYFAAFPGCSAESEPSAQTLAFLIDKVRAEGIPVVFYIEFSAHRAADVIAEETGAQTRLFHGCHNVSLDELDAGATYLSLMTANALALEEALR